MVVETSTVVYRALSLGAGVQSSVLALLLSHSDPRLAEHGYSKPDIAVFADTGWEPDYVYRHLDWLEQQLDYPLIRVSSGDLKTNLRKARTVSGHSFVDVPLFTVNEGREEGHVAAAMHQPLQGPAHLPANPRAGGRAARPALPQEHPRRDVARHFLGRGGTHQAQPGTLGRASLAARGHADDAPGFASSGLRRSIPAAYCPARPALSVRIGPTSTGAS